MTLTLDAPLVVASDIHLRQPDDERARLLHDVLERLGPGVEYFVLNGDIFDFCYGGSPFFRNKFAALGQALSRVAARGVRVVFVEGNHEFHMDRIGWQGVEVIKGRDYALTLRSGTRILFSHGDLLKGDKLYGAFRALVKSTFARWCAFFVPGAWLDAYSLKHAQVSRSHDKYRKLDHGRILAAFNRWINGSDAEHGIIGHFHVPYAEKRETSDGLLLSVDSWDRPNLLVYAAGGFQRGYLQRPQEPFRLEPVESIFRSSRPT